MSAPSGIGKTRQAAIVSVFTKPWCSRGNWRSAKFRRMNCESKAKGKSCGWPWPSQSVFRSPLREGKVGRPRLIPWPDLCLAQIIKQYAKRRVVQGQEALVQRLRVAGQGRGVLNTSYVERFNAIARSRLASLVRRGRALARTVPTLEAGMYLCGGVYNFCSWHESLRQPLYLVQQRREQRRCVNRTPAMAAALTDHRWTVLELLSFKVAPPPWVEPKRRGRPPKALALAQPA